MCNSPFIVIFCFQNSQANNADAATIKALPASDSNNGFLLQYKAEVTTMLKDMDFGVYGKGIDGYVHYSLAMERIREEEESRKALMDEFDNDEDNFDSDDLDSDDFGLDDFGGDDF